MRGIIFRHREINPAVGSCDVEHLALPTRAGKFDVDATVSRAPFDCAADCTQRHAAILRLEIYLTGHFIDRNAAVVSSQRQIGMARHEYLEAHVPLIPIARLGTLSMDVEPDGFDAHLLSQRVSFGLRR